MLRTRNGRTLRAAIVAATCVAATEIAGAQEPGVAPPTMSVGALSLSDALGKARRHSPELLAAREGARAAAARERQADAFPNPTLSYAREQTSGGGESNAQDIASLDQPLELGGQRAARRDVARLRREAAEARVRAAEAQLDYEVTRAFALALAADRRATLAAQAADALGTARTVGERRLAAGDISGYANRRIRLEAARYAVLRAEALLERRAARLALSSLIAPAADSIAALDVALVDAPNAGWTTPGEPVPSVEALRALALRGRPDLTAAQLDAQASAAEAGLAARERVPVPVLTAGIKREEVAGADESLNGFVAGLSMPLPIWDRRRGSVDAAAADARRRTAETEALRRRTLREVEEAHAAFQAAAEQAQLLQSQLGAESRAALRAAQVAYTEGEITLVDWLDAARAYQEVEASWANLRADGMIRRAALLRAAGLTLSPPTNPAAAPTTGTER